MYWSNYVTCIPEFKGDVTEVIFTLERHFWSVSLVWGKKVHFLYPLDLNCGYLVVCVCGVVLVAMVFG